MNYRPIKDGTTVYSGFAFKRNDLTPNGDIPVIKIGNLVGKTVDYKKTDFFSCELLSDKIKKYFLDDKDVLIAMTGQGSVGRVAQLRKKHLNDVLLLNQRVGKFVCNPHKLDNDYLFYVLSSKYYQEMLFNLGYGSGQPNLSPDTILNILIPFPDIITQKHIASILSSFDDKIELNTAINENLEQQISEYFKKIFPNVLDINGQNRLEQLISFSNGKKRPNEIGIIPVFGGNGILAYTNKSNASNCVIVGRVGAYCGNVSLSLSDCWISDNAISAKSKLTGSQLFIYNLLKNASLPSRHIGTGQPLMTQGILNAIPCIIPQKDKIMEFEDTVIPFQSLITSNEEENQRLATLRDTLLPKLMNGEIDVSEVKI